MNTSLWIAQGLLTAVFALSGTLKALWSKEHLLRSGQTGVVHLDPAAIKLAAACELAGAIAVVVPWATSTARVLTPVAAIGLGLIMVLAARVHWGLGETRNVAVNLVLLALCTFVAAGRLR